MHGCGKVFIDARTSTVLQVLDLRAKGEFPQLIWKDTAPQHFKTTFGEYPEEKPKPPFECVPVGKEYQPSPGTDKWRLREDHSVEVLFPEFNTIAEGGWRNKVLPLLHIGWPLSCTIVSPCDMSTNLCIKLLPECICTALLGLFLKASDALDHIGEGGERHLP
jgi:hypothetical protein